MSAFRHCPHCLRGYTGKACGTCAPDEVRAALARTLGPYQRNALFCEHCDTSCCYWPCRANSAAMDAALHPEETT